MMRFAGALVGIAAAIAIGCFAGSRAAVYLPPTSIDTTIFAKKTDVPALSPVQSVNTQTGAVSIAVLTRQASGLQDITSGTMTWTFPQAFSSTPSCVPSIVSGSVSYVFSFPTASTISATSITVNVRAANVSLLTLGVVWGFPPAGSTMNITCNGFLPQ